MGHLILSRKWIAVVQPVSREGDKLLDPNRASTKPKRAGVIPFPSLSGVSDLDVVRGL